MDSFSSSGITIEGYTPEEILALPDEQVEAVLFAGSPFVFCIGSARILGECRLKPDRLIIELAHIDGGGEGVLATLWTLARAYGVRRGLDGVEWIVHALHCANPNPKLRRILALRGFEVRNIEGMGEAYWVMDALEYRRGRDRE